MNDVESVFLNPQFRDESPYKRNIFTGLDLSSDAYYLKPKQVVEYHNHPNGDQVFFFLKGSGKFHLDNGTEEIINVSEGSSVYVPAGIWHKITNSDKEMVAVQVTSAGAGMQPRWQ
jgi:quercetin dioxygenase-like cupin family protein